MMSQQYYAKDVELLIVAYDPGVTTGWATYDSDDDKYEVGQLDSSRMGVFEHLQHLFPDVVCYEDFKYRPQMGHAELYSVQIIGVIETWCEMREITPATTPTSSEAKAFWKDDKIKALGLWTKGLKHAMDALRVLLLHREKTDKEWFMTQLERLR